ncbi:hypothetical protein DOY81_005740, partial [Sarcophaga bullata]
MDKKFKNSTNIKGYNLSPAFGSPTVQSDKLCENSYLIPTTATTSIPPVILTSTINSTKDATGLNQYQHHRNTRQRTCSAQQNAFAAECSQSTLAQKNHINNNVNSNSNNMNNQQIAMSAKAAACIASPMEQLAAVHAKATSSRNKNE